MFEPSDRIVSTLAGGKGWIGSTDLGHTPLRPSPVLAPCILDAADKSWATFGLVQAIWSVVGGAGTP